MVMAKHPGSGEPDLERPEADPALGPSFPIVGVGASAGGLEAFRRLLGALPKRTGMAYVLVQHLDPRHESILAELLSGGTAMQVSEVTCDVRVEPNRVYVIPPSRDLILADGQLRLVPRTPSGAVHMPIDSFLRTLAQAQSSQAIGVILSGMGSDGTLGLRAIEAEGGITFAQEPSSAKHDAMPRSAIEAGVVDFVLAPEDIARELMRLERHPYLGARDAARLRMEPSTNAKRAAKVDGPESLARVLTLVRQAGGGGLQLLQEGHPSKARRASHGREPQLDTRRICPPPRRTPRRGEGLGGRLPDLRYFVLP